MLDVSKNLVQVRHSVGVDLSCVLGVSGQGTELLEFSLELLSLGESVHFFCPVSALRDLLRLVRVRDVEDAVVRVEVVPGRYVEHLLVLVPDPIFPVWEVPVLLLQELIILELPVGPGIHGRHDGLRLVLLVVDRVVTTLVDLREEGFPFVPVDMFLRNLCMKMSEAGTFL